VWLLGLGNKLDKVIKPYLKINSKRRIPVIVSYRDNLKGIKNKIITSGGKIKYECLNIRAVACEIPSYGLDKLSEIPEVSFISFDYKASLCLRKTRDIMGVGFARTFNLTGRGVGVGIIDSGVYPHPDLTSKRTCISYFEDLINGHIKAYDDNGHGTFTAGLIASSGTSSSEMYSGIAPDSNLLCIKAFDASGKGFMSDILKGTDILISQKDRYNLRVICLPFEFPYLEKLKINPLEEIIKKALSLKIAIVAPSGNSGPQAYSVYCPGNIKDVITVGGAQALDTNIKSTKVSSFSGRGPTLEDVSKPDIIAPSVNITSLGCDTSYNPSIKRLPSLQNLYVTLSGTSAACALIAGMCALIIEKTPDLSPQDLKSILCLSTISLGDNKFSQGKGMFIFDKIVK
jgi:serine protease AprX